MTQLTNFSFYLFSVLRRSDGEWLQPGPLADVPRTSHVKLVVEHPDGNTYTYGVPRSIAGENVYDQFRTWWRAGAATCPVLDGNRGNYVARDNTPAQKLVKLRNSQLPLSAKISRPKGRPKNTR